MINTRDLFQSTLDSPAAEFSFVLGFARAPGALTETQRKKWVGLFGRLDGMVRARYGQDVNTNPLFLQWFRALLAVRIKQHDDRSDDELLGEAMGDERERPASAQTIEENHVEADRARKAEAARNATEGHPRRAQ